jgi:hypothetical protein
MAENEHDSKDRADQLHGVIDRLTAGAAARDRAPVAPTGPGESLREAVHRRMHELEDSEDDTRADQPHAEQPQRREGESA